MDRVNVLCGASLCSGYIIKKSGIKFDYVSVAYLLDKYTCTSFFSFN